MKVSTWNVNGIRAREGDVLAWVEREAPDVLCLQEIKASRENVPLSLCAMGGYWCYWHGFKGYSGVSLHLSKAMFPEEPRFEHPAFDRENRIVMARVGDWLFASIYVPNGNKDFPAKIEFLQQLEELVISEHARGTTLLLCGDLNVAKEERDVHPSLRKPEQIGQTPQERILFGGMLNRQLVDLQRVFEPDNDSLYTWWAPWRNLREKNVGWRLDYIVPSEGLARKAKSCQSFRQFGTSDHAPVLATFDVTPPQGRSARTASSGGLGESGAGANTPGEGTSASADNAATERDNPPASAQNPSAPTRPPSEKNTAQLGFRFDDD